MGVMSGGGCEAAVAGTRGKGLPRAACPQGPGHFRGTAWPWPRGTAPVPRRRALLIKGAGGEGAGLCEQRPGRAPPHLPAPLPREFVKQISLIAQAKEFVGEKKPGKFPSSGPPLPRFPRGSRRRVSRSSPRPPALREAVTLTLAGRSCGLSSCHPCLRKDVPCSTSSQPGHTHSLPSSPRGQTLSPNAVTPSTAVCPSRLAFSIAWLSTPGNGLCEPPVGSP